ncbi:MAPEG family protein, partial [Pseudomonadota bacterium]|nr:MAPEG family protein [Pseudomonadota bacterium]
MLKSKMTKEMFQRSRRATENLKESLPAFLALAILSIGLDVQANVLAASCWLLLRVIFAGIYVSGFNLKTANASG